MSPHSALVFVLLMALILACTLYGLAASGHFPAQHRLPALKSGAGGAILYGTIAITLAAVVAGIVAAWQALPWPALIIGGGAMLLAAPLLLRLFPDRFVDGRAALVTFAAAAAACALLLGWISF
jgi:hypothetical protein